VMAASPTPSSPDCHIEKHILFGILLTAHQENIFLKSKEK